MASPLYRGPGGHQSNGHRTAPLVFVLCGRAAGSLAGSQLAFQAVGRGQTVLRNKIMFTILSGITFPENNLHVLHENTVI